jgi:serine protease Do
MNDEPTPAAPQGDGAPDPLDETQRVEVPRYAPAPDPRPDARWAWAASGDQAAADRWQVPAAAMPSAVPGSTTGWGSPGGSATGSIPGWGTPVATEPVQPAEPRRRSGPGVGALFGVSLLSAVLASGATVLVLGQEGAFNKSTPASTAGAAQQGSAQSVTIDESSAVITAAAKVSPAVVKITTEGQSANPFGGTPTKGIGSGLIYDASGWILTNRHVVSDAKTLTVELKDGRQFAGRVYGIDTLTDLAIVKIDQTGLPVAPIGHSDGLKVGQLVIAIGSPLGTYSFSVTSGIVSGKGRDIQVDSGQTIRNLIQTDAAINPGNSGGPLVDAEGSVVGINTAVATDSSGIGFAIPIDIARPIMQQAMLGQALKRPYIGINFVSIDPQVKDKNKLTVDAGALITDNGSGTDPIASGSPAEKAGLKAGDVVLSINGQRIDSEHPLDALLVQYAPGDTVTLNVLRDGTSLNIDVTLGTRPENIN